MRQIRRRTCAVAVAACAAMGVGSLGTSAHAATLLAQYSAANYDAVTGIWTDSVGGAHNATSIEKPLDPLPQPNIKPALVTGVTPNGSSAVNFDGNHWFSIGNGGVAMNGNDGVEVFAYVSADTTSFRRGIVGSGKDPGSFGSGLSYSLKVAATATFQQQMGRASQATSQLSLNTHPAYQFANISWAGTPNGGSFRYNGTDDGTTGGTFFDSTLYPVSVLGMARDYDAARTDQFIGNIAEIRIYSGAMTSEERLGVETELTTHVWGDS